MARKWIKLWVSESLRGTIRFDFTPAERGVWYDLLALAGDCRQDGLISPGKGLSYPPKWIAGTLNIRQDLLKKTLDICEKSSRILINGDGIKVLNWKKYQSEYERQRPFRYKKVTQKVTNHVTEKLPVEEEGDIEVEVEKKKKKEENFEDFKLSLKDQYPELDIDNEHEKFKLYWSEGKKPLKRPKTAFKNWLDKAMEIKNKGVNVNGINKSRIGEVPGTGQPEPSQISQRKVNRKCKVCGDDYEVHILSVNGVDKPYVERCPSCQKQVRLEERTAQLQEELKLVIQTQTDKWKFECNLPGLFIDKTFENFDRKLQPQAFDTVKKYLDFEKSEGQSIVLLSPNIYGVGKTHLMAALINEMINTYKKAKISKEAFYIMRFNCPVYFTTESRLLSRIRATFNSGNDETEEQVYSKLDHYDLLIIDDVGKVRPRDYSFLQGVYFRIIDGRYVNEQSIILTTNLDYAELEAHIGGASADRLREMAGKNFIKMLGKSYRH